MSRRISYWPTALVALALAAGSPTMATGSEASAEAPARVQVGDSAPAIDLPASDGTQYSTGQMTGDEEHQVLIFFRGAW